MGILSGFVLEMIEAYSEHSIQLLIFLPDLRLQVQVSVGNTSVTWLTQHWLSERYASDPQFLHAKNGYISKRLFIGVQGPSKYLGGKSTEKLNEFIQIQGNAWESNRNFETSTENQEA